MSPPTRKLLSKCLKVTEWYSMIQYGTVQHSMVLYGTVLYCTVRLSQYSHNHYYPFSTFKRVSVNKPIRLIVAIKRYCLSLLIKCNVLSIVYSIIYSIVYYMIKYNNLLTISGPAGRPLYRLLICWNFDKPEEG